MSGWLHPGWTAPIRAYRVWRDNRVIDEEIEKVEQRRKQSQRKGLGEQSISSVLNAVRNYNFSQTHADPLDDEVLIQDEVWMYSIREWEMKVGKTMEIDKAYHGPKRSGRYLVTRVEQYDGVYGSAPMRMARVYGKQVP